MVVNGAGQQGLWEDVAGRLGDMASVRAFRSNIVKVAGNSAQAKQSWTEDPSIDAWLIWSIWQVANAKVADQVAVEPQYAIYRDTGIALTKRGEAADVKKFARFLASPRKVRRFSKSGAGLPRNVDRTCVHGNRHSNFPGTVAAPATDLLQRSLPTSRDRRGDSRAARKGRGKP